MGLSALEGLLELSAAAAHDIMPGPWLISESELPSPEPEAFEPTWVLGGSAASSWKSSGCSELEARCWSPALSFDPRD